MLKQDTFFAALIILYLWVIFRCLEPLLFPSRVPSPLGNFTASPPLTNSTPSIPRYWSCKKNSNAAYSGYNQAYTYISFLRNNFVEIMVYV